MDGPTVLLVGAGDPDVAAFEADFSSEDRPITVRQLEDLADLYTVLTNEVIHCLVVPATVDAATPVRIAHGVRGLYPDVPIVVAGSPEQPIPADLDVTVTEGDSLTDQEVIDAVREALDREVESDAARPPSRMETLLQSMLQQFPVHLYAKDDEARHLITSSTNQSPTELIGLTDLEYTELPEEHREAAFNDDMSVIEGDGKQVEVEEYTDYIDSHTLTSKVPWFDEDGDVIGLVGLTRDITERKKREQASRRQHELLVKVALIAAHELRNELQVASGRLELLDDDSEQVEVIADSQGRLANIVDKVVELASEERPRPEKQGLWLSTLCREVWDTLEADEASLEVAEDVHFVADRESMSLFLQILFKNAIQHGDSDVTVTVGAMEGGLYVADDGTGIDADPPERVFDAGYTTDPNSTGFGLYVARSVADEHGWRIDLAESEDGGARFDVIGPTVESDEGPER